MGNEQASCQYRLYHHKYMNALDNNRNLDSPVDIFASFSGVMGDAPRQLVTKSVSGGPDRPQPWLSASRSLDQRFQGTDEFFVVVPARHGALVYLLPHLPGAGSGHL